MSANPKRDPVTEISEVIGFEAALKLIAFAGGQHRRVPLEAIEEHWLTHVIGIEAAGKLCAVYGGEIVYFPKGHMDVIAVRNRAIRAARAGGDLVRDIASRFKLTERQIYTIVGSLEG